MKPIRTLAIVHPNTALETLHATAADFPLFAITIQTQPEAALEQMGQAAFDLLLVDKNLPEPDYRKLNKLAGILFPDAAFTNLNFGDADFLRFKLEHLMAQWKLAQDEGERRFFDHPGQS